MDHSEASSGHAVDRYLLGEMAEPEVEAFEQHFFECTICTEELASGALLAENVRAEAASRTVAPERRARIGFRQWWGQPLFAAPVFAAVALAFIVMYQARELARSNRPQALLLYTLKSGSRGEANRIPADKTNIVINVDLPDTSFPKYRCVLSGLAGQRYFSLESEAPPAGEPLSLVVPRGLAAGTYILKVQGLRDSQAGPEITYTVEAVKE